ncbi:AAA family ATPase [Idiomarina seosinensis]|uniref:Rad50/SbcC-type AAA domain-containing protein n=1 Tax=Idiomarina seosinensis TaxID=281739 RepID=A0A432Z6Y5_9GAMM|nr:SMC family ATPase [Idiomarina seosinensis]RUO73678.1 hypothetical protein CWI81_11685 [Idiomarina seosinensis]
MKPLLLSMQAFGPFAGTENINFNELGEHPLFLINGATGAGKTTILDAISYALFGKTTGAERQGEQMRCHHAAADLITQVNFVFSIGDRCYHVQRTPTQQRPKLRGEGYKEERASANLWQIKTDVEPTLELDAADKQLLASRKVNEVTAQLEQIIGLKADQFRQVVVLPQGKFRELLTADAGERENIFAQLFQTHRYQHIEEQLKEQAKDIRQQMRQHQQTLAALLDEADAEDEQQLNWKLNQFSEQVQALENDKKMLADRFQKKLSELQAAQHCLEQFNQQQRLTEQKTELEQRQPEFDAIQQQLERANQAQQLVPYEQRLTLVKERLKQQQQALNSWQQQLEELDLKQQQAEQEKALADQLEQENSQLTQSIQQQQQWLPKLKSLTELQQQHQQQADAVHQQQMKVDQAKQQKQQRKEQISHTEQTIETLEKSITQHQNTDIKRQRLTDQKQQLIKHQQLSEQRQPLVDQAAQQQKQLQELASQTQAAGQRSQQLEQLWYQSQASNLAQQLESGQPCPVCGSRQHPEPSLANEHEVIEHQQVIEAREAFQKQQLLQQNKEQELYQTQQKIELLEQQLQQLGKLESAEQLEQFEQQLSAQEHQQQQQLEQLSTEQKQLKQQRQQSDNDSEQLDQQTHQLHQQQLDLKVTAQNLQQLQAEVPEAMRDADALQKRLAEQQQQLQDNQQRQKQATQQLQEILQQLSAKKLQVNEGEKQLADLNAEAEKLEQQLIQQRQQLGFSSQQQYREALLTSEQRQQLEKKLQSFRQQQHTVTSVLAELEQQLKGVQRPDTIALEKAKDELQQTFSEAESRWLTARDQQSQLQNMQQRLSLTKKRADTLHKRYAVSGTLADVASGTNPQRLSLHRFVLGVLLDDVLRVASQRLTKMTHGRYQLIRDESVSDARSAGGLTILVEDTYTGQQRSAKTLSGGESFMAALALALGLSDVVQSYAGGIRLDTLFIDEGFGSLDDEALDAAIDVLAELRSSGRTIGIISHVRELKDRLHDRIDVIRQRGGSKIMMRTE